MSLRRSWGRSWGRCWGRGVAVRRVGLEGLATPKASPRPGAVARIRALVGLGALMGVVALAGLGTLAGTAVAQQGNAVQMKRGKAAYANRDFRQAEQQFQEATLADENDAAAFMWLGHSIYQQERYKDSEAPYEKARELSAKSKQLSDTEMKVINDNLGIAYGITGEVQKAQAFFEERIKEDPDYPLYYYNLACAHSEQNHLEETISTLQAAWDRRAHLLKGEAFPDPRGDPSFKRYLNSARFRKVLKGMGFPVED